MKYKGYELLKAIAENKIKNGSKFMFKINQDIEKVYWNGENFKYIENRRNIMLDYADIELINGTFELIEDEIDIDNIKEYKQEHTERCIDVDVRNKINELIQAIKQINKEVKELKEDK